MWRRYPRLGAALAWLGLAALLAGVVALPLLRYSKNWSLVERRWPRRIGSWCWAARAASA